MTASSSAINPGRLVEFGLKLIGSDQLRMAIEEADGDLRLLVELLMNHHDILNVFGILLRPKINKRLLLEHLCLDVFRGQLIDLLRPLSLVIIRVHETGQDDLSHRGDGLQVLRPRPVRVDPERAWTALARDKKAAGGAPQLVLLERPGEPRWGVELPEADVRAALDSLIA